MNEFAKIERKINTFLFAFSMLVCIGGIAWGFIRLHDAGMLFEFCWNCRWEQAKVVGVAYLPMFLGAIFAAIFDYARKK